MKRDNQEYLKIKDEMIKKSKREQKSMNFAENF